MAEITVTMTPEEYRAHCLVRLQQIINQAIAFDVDPDKIEAAMKPLMELKVAVETAKADRVAAAEALAGAKPLEPMGGPKVAASG